MALLAGQLDDSHVPPTLKHHARSSFFPSLHCPAWVLRFVHEGQQEYHDHEFFELVAVEGGEAVHSTFRGTRPIAAGEVLFLRPGFWHRYEQCRSLAVLNCLIDPGLFRHELAWLRDEPAFVEVIWQHAQKGLEDEGVFRLSLEGGDWDVLLEALAGIESAQAREFDAMRKTAVLGHLLRALAILGHAIEQRRRGQPARPPLHGAVREALRLIDEQPEAPWTLASLAHRALNVSPSHLLALFRVQLGQSPMAVLNRNRMERAASLLVGGSDPIAQVAARVGIEDPNYFSRRFKSMFGCTPRAFRSRGG